MNVAILQARVSSTRLPGKVLLPLLGEPMLARQLERVRRATTIDELVVATSIESDDDAIEILCDRAGVRCHRGALDDVLDRFYQAACVVGAAPGDSIVRLTGDCPLADPGLIDEMVRFHVSHPVDCTSNGRQPTYPDGLDIEIMRYEAFDRAWREAKRPSEREHVTAYLYNNPGAFSIHHFRQSRDLSHLRWTVDEPEDFVLISRIYAALYPGDSQFTTDDVLDLIERSPELATLNVHIRRNEGLHISEANDET